MSKNSCKYVLKSYCIVRCFEVKCCVFLTLRIYTDINSHAVKQIAKLYLLV